MNISNDVRLMDICVNIKKLESSNQALKGERSLLLKEIEHIKNSPDYMKLMTERKNATSSLKNLNNQQPYINGDIRHCKDKITSQQMIIKESIQNIAEIDKAVAKMSNKVLDDTPLRLKNGNLKSVQTGCFKTLFNKARYNNEIYDAKRKFGISDSEYVTINSLKKSVNTQRNDILAAEKSIKVNEAELKSLKRELSTISDEKCFLQDKVKDVDEKINSKLELTSKKETSIDAMLEANKYQAMKLSNERNNILSSKKETLAEFGCIYQSNAGCRAINNMARGIYQGKGPGLISQLSGNKIVSEYKKAFEDNFRAHEWTELSREIKSICDKFNENTSASIKKAAEAVYSPGGREIKTFRGQGITERGFATIKKAYDNAKDTNLNSYPVFKASQFFSTSLDETVAKGFSRAASNERAIMFEIHGNSSSDINTKNGLRFSEGGEEEKMYSPVACFAVTKIEGNTIHLKEVVRNDNCSPLPY